MHVHAERAVVDLRGADLDQLGQLRVEALPGRDVQPDHRLVDLGACFAHSRRAGSSAAYVTVPVVSVVFVMPSTLGAGQPRGMVQFHGGTLGHFRHRPAPRPERARTAARPHRRPAGSRPRRRLAPGTRLPSSRSLAADLGIARNTVADAYADLIAEGWLTARQGSGTRVAERAVPARPAAPTPRPPPARSRTA